jgi:transposase InsO family protein
MPWKVAPVSQIRFALVHAVRSAGVPVVQAARRFGVSRKTAYKWLRRYDDDPQQPLCDGSRRPHHCPRQVTPQVERQILQARDRFGWGARKLRAYLAGQGHPVPSTRTTHAVLTRNGRLAAPETPALPPQCFERPEPHDLWQADHKGPVEVARREHFPLVVEDDHSRFLIALHPCLNKTMALAWEVLWGAFAEFGLPKAFLSDNAFGTTFEVPKTLSWIDARLVRLGIQPIHGRPYHPQTQGKVERFNGTLQREMLPRARTDCLEHFTADLATFRDLYNHTRPHQALGDKPPVSRFAKSPRGRPSVLPEPESFYPPGSILRKVSTSGDVRWNQLRILAGRGLVGHVVRLEQRAQELAIFYCWKQIRCIPLERMTDKGML